MIGGREWVIGDTGLAVFGDDSLLSLSFFLTAVALWLFGGPVLNGFAFALVIGIIIGTYSSIFIASPILVFWQNWLESRKRVAPVAVPALKETAAKKAVRTR